MKFVVARLLQTLVALFVTSVVVFSLARLTGNPLDAQLPMEMTPAERQAALRELGFTEPIAYQYLVWVRALAQGDFGRSFSKSRRVFDLIPQALSNSLQLAGGAILLALLISLPLGTVAALNRGRLWDRVAMTVALLGQSLPSFWTAIMGILIFSVFLRWLPTSGIGGWEHYVLPVVTLGAAVAAGIVRLVRSSMLDVLDSEYIKMARLKGLPERIVIGKHALRNAVLPVLTFVGFMYGLIIGGAIITEVVFAWPGLGRLAYDAVVGRDYPLLQATVLVWAGVILGINLLVDVAYMVLDPRIRL